jgi:hypothetical protein
MTRVEISKTSPKAFLNNKEKRKEVKMFDELTNFILNKYTYKWSKDSKDMEIRKIKPFLKNLSTINWEIFFSNIPCNCKTLDNLFKFYYNNEKMDAMDIDCLCEQNNLTFWDIIKEIDNLYKLISCLPSYNSDPKFGIVEEHSLGTLINFLVNKLSCMNLFEDMRPIYRRNQEIFNKLYC